MNLQLAVVDGTFNDKRACRPQRDFLPEPVALDLTDEVGLREFFTSRIHSAWQFAGPRKKANTMALLAVPFDFDDGKLTFEDALARFGQYAGVVYTSSSHTEAHPKLRVLLVLAEPLTDRSVFDSVCDWLKAHYPDADQAVFKVSQPLFPCCQFDGGTATTGFPLFRLAVLPGEPFRFPTEVTQGKTQQAGEEAHPSPPAEYVSRNRAELDRLLAYYREYPIRKGDRDRELLSLCAKYRKCGYSEAETREALCDFNRDFVKPPYAESGTGGEDKSIEQVVRNVFAKELQPPAPDNWPALKAALDEGETKAVANLPAEDFLASLRDDRSRLLSPAQCFFDDAIYYMVGTDKRQMLVGPGPVYMDKQKAEQMGMRFREVVPAMRFTDVLSYIKGTRQVRPGEIFSDVRKYLSDYLYLPEPLNYDYLALWIMGTYSFMAWEAYPYVSVRGPANSGKTTLLERVASIAFNANGPGSMTPAALRDTVARDSGTVCVDEAEKLRGRERKEEGLDALEILNLGYKKSGMATKMEPSKGKRFEVVHFPCYSPKAMAGINDLHLTLRTRCHEIQMNPMLPGESSRLRKYQSTRPSIKGREDRIRNDLYIYTLQHFYAPPSMLPTSAHLVGRQFELWNPILFYAELVDEDNGNAALSEAMLKLASLSAKSTSDDVGEEDLGLKLLVALRDLFSDQIVKPAANADFGSGELAYTVEQVYKYLRERPEFSWLDPEGQKKTWLTRTVKELGFRDDRRRVEVPGWPDSDGPVRLYRFDKLKFADTCARRLGQPPDMRDFLHNNTKESEEK